MGLWFRFMLAAVLVIQGWSSYSWAGLTCSWDLFCSSSHPTSQQWGARGVERGHRWDSKMSKRTFHTLWHHTQHVQLGEGGRKKAGGHLEGWCSSSQASVTCDEALLPRGWLNTSACPWEGKGWEKSLVCFACMHDFYLLNCLHLKRVLSL